MQRQTHSYTYEQIRDMAISFASSNMFGVKTPEQALSLLMMAEAEGMHPARALQEYHIISGKPTLKSEAMLARFQQAGGRIKWVEHTNERVCAIFTHDSSGDLEIEWDMVRAGEAGIKSAMFKKYPRQMLRARVISEGVRASYPACIVGFYTPEEVQEFAPQQSPLGRDLPPPEQPMQQASKAASRDLFEELQKQLRACVGIEGLQAWGEQNKKRIAMLPKDWAQSLRDEYRAELVALKELAASEAETAPDAEYQALENMEPENA